jgi:hypothetical protein
MHLHVGLESFWYSHQVYRCPMLCLLVVVQIRIEGKVSLLFGLLLFGFCGKRGMIVCLITLRWMLRRWLILSKDCRGNGS